MHPEPPSISPPFVADPAVGREAAAGRIRALKRAAHRRRLRMQALLYLLTCATTFAAGVVGWQPMLLGFDDDLLARLGGEWARGLAYMIAVMAVLTAHEAGHFIAARWHRIPATLPFFLPVPILLTGTLGAVIGMEGSRANRRQLFDIALAGPIAGLVVAVPVMAVGMLLGTPSDASPFALSPLARWMLAVVRPDAAEGIEPNALFMAGWVGLLVTGLNMIPVSQLDGGHVSYAIFGRHAKWVARSVLAGAVVAIAVLGLYNWIAMVVIVMLMGTDHPPIREDGRPLGRVRTVVGLLALLIPIVTFMPEPLLVE
jgi:membrane-associated protease RseP (regulator of RpoE activity)